MEWQNRIEWNWAIHHIDRIATPWAWKTYFTKDRWTLFSELATKLACPLSLSTCYWPCPPVFIESLPSELCLESLPSELCLPIPFWSSSLPGSRRSLVGTICFVTAARSKKGNAVLGLRIYKPWNANLYLKKARPCNSISVESGLPLVNCLCELHLH